jgi:hypothetical protein
MRPVDQGKYLVHYPKESFPSVHVFTLLARIYLDLHKVQSEQEIAKILTV